MNAATQIASIASLFVYGARADEIPEQDIRSSATNERLRSFIGQEGGFGALSDSDCQSVRDAIDSEVVTDLAAEVGLLSFSGFNFGTLAAALPAPVLRREDVLRVYTGKQGCMCGCRGRYYVGKAMADKADEMGASVNEAQVSRVLGLINAASRDARRDAEGSVVWIDMGERLALVYVRPGSDVSAFEVEQ
jgi:hypothetical protein